MSAVFGNCNSLFNIMDLLIAEWSNNPCVWLAVNVPVQAFV